MTRPSPARLRGAAGFAIVGLAVASMLGAAHVSAGHHDDHAFSSVSAAATDATSHSISFVTHSKVTTNRLIATRPAREWRLVTDALLLGIALALAAMVWRNRVARLLHQRLRGDAFFARRRGPPLLHLAR